MSADETNILDRLIRNHETSAEYLQRRYNLGPLLSRSAEASPPKRSGDPFTNLTVRFIFERAVITWREGEYRIEPAPEGQNT